MTCRGWEEIISKEKDKLVASRSSTISRRQEQLQYVIAKKVSHQPIPKPVLVFMCLQYKPLENTVGEGEISCKEKYLLFTQCFVPIWRTFCHFHQFEIYLQTLLVWIRV